MQCFRIDLILTIGKAFHHIIFAFSQSLSLSLSPTLTHSLVNNNQLAANKPILYDELKKLFCVSFLCCICSFNGDLHALAYNLPMLKQIWPNLIIARITLIWHERESEIVSIRQLFINKVDHETHFANVGWFCAVRKQISNEID